MRSQKALTLLSPLLERGCFTSQEAKEKGVHPATLCYYSKIGILKRVRRGVYQKANYQNLSVFRWEDLIEAVCAIKGSVVCLISALAVYNLTEEIPRQHWIAIRHGTSAKTTKEIKIVRYRDMELGKTEVNLEGITIPIFDRERTIIDAFRLLSHEIAIKALKMAIAQKGKERINLVKLQEYAKKLQVSITPYLMSITT